ncbi:MAG: YbjN domain-containing protein [Pseudomonadota bacterium]
MIQPFAHALTRFAAAIALLFALPAMAQDEAPERVSARDADGVLAALKGAGYEAELTRDEETGEQQIDVELRGGPARVLFADCDEEETRKCDTLVLSVYYIRNLPISDRAIRVANQEHRYVSVWRDGDGDPVVQWAILTQDIGVATPLFLEALNRYSDIIDDFGAVAWDGDIEEENTGTGTLFVANKRGNSLSKIDLASGEETKRVDSCTNPHELATSPNGQYVALACYGGTTVDIFEAATMERLKSIELGENARPHGIVWHGYGDIYVTAEGRKSIFHVQGPLYDDVFLYEFPTGKEGSHMLAVSDDASTAWTTDLGSKTVTRIDLRTRAEPLSVTVGEEPEGIALTPDSETLWVSARGSNQAFALDPATMEVRETLDTGKFPLRLAVRPQGDFAVTSDLADGSLSVIDLAKNTVSRTITVSGEAEAQERFQVTILWSRDGSLVYVAETASDTIAEVDFESGKVLRRIKVGEGGDGLAIVP